MSIYKMNIIGEENDTTPIINSHNIVIQTRYNGFVMMSDANFFHWETMFIFPDSEKAVYFKDNMNDDVHNFREAMLRDDYIFHIINCTYPKPRYVYADQLTMSKDIDYSITMALESF